MSRRYELRHGRMGAALAVRVSPKASRNAIAGVQADGTIRVSVTAPANEGQANDALVGLLAEVLGVAKSRIEIVAGATGRDKLVSVIDLDAATAQRRILAHMG